MAGCLRMYMYFCFINSLRPGDVKWHQGPWLKLIQVMACCLRTPRHYLEQYWLIVSWTLRGKHQWILDQNKMIFIQENAFRNIVCKISAVLFRPQCVDKVYNDRMSCQCFVEKMMISMAWCKTAVTPLLMHWSYCSLAQSLWYITPSNNPYGLDLEAFGLMLAIGSQS